MHRRAKRSPRSSAACTACAGSAPTATVTSRSPRSLSSRRLRRRRAAHRRMLDVDRVGDQRGGGIRHRRRVGQHGDRIGDAQETGCARASPRWRRRATGPTRRRAAGRRSPPHRDRPPRRRRPRRLRRASSAMSPPLLTHARRMPGRARQPAISCGDAPATAAIGVTNRRSVRHTAGRRAPCAAQPGRADRPRPSSTPADLRSRTACAAARVRRPARRAGRRKRSQAASLAMPTAALSPSIPISRSIGPCWKCQRPSASRGRSAPPIIAARLPARPPAATD